MAHQEDKQIFEATMADGTIFHKRSASREYKHVVVGQFKESRDWVTYGWTSSDDSAKSLYHGLKRSGPKFGIHPDTIDILATTPVDEVTQGSQPAPTYRIEGDRWVPGRKGGRRKKETTPLESREESKGKREKEGEEKESSNIEGVYHNKRAAIVAAKLQGKRVIDVKKIKGGWIVEEYVPRSARKKNRGKNRKRV
jgi:hypothetical protein